MKKLVPIVYLTALCFSCIAQGDFKIRSEYYAVLPFWESPYIPFCGAVPLTESEASKRVHLRLDYNNENRIVTAQVKMGKYLKDFEGRFGNLYINATTTKVTYGEKTEEHQFFDRFDRQISVQGNIYRKLYKKDYYGRNISLTFLDSIGNAAVDIFGNAKYSWEHLEDGSIIELRFNPEEELMPLRGDFQLMRTKMTFGIDGYFSILQNIDEQGNPINAECGAAILKYFYDNQGRFDRWEVYDSLHRPAIGPSNTSGEQNIYEGFYLKKIVFFDTIGNPATHWSGVEQWNKRHDKYGNVTELNFQDANGKPKNGEYGFASIRYEWSPDGRFLLSKSYYNQYDQLFENQGRARIEYVRDKRNVVIDEQWFNSLGIKVNKK